MSEERRAGAFGWFIWILAVLFFIYEFFLRVLPATMAKEIIDTLHLSLEQFAFIGSSYYIAYAVMQIPAGLSLDRLSARLLLSFAVAFCTFGVLWFGFAHSFGVAFVSRLFIGLGSGFGFIGLMVVTLNWFPKKYFAFLIGIGQLLGALGPLFAGGPIALMLRAVDGDWRIIFFWVGIVGIVLTALFALFFRGKPKRKRQIVFIDKKEPIRRQILALLKRGQVWIVLLYAAATYVSLPILGAFWGSSYVQTRGYSPQKAAFLVSFLWVGFAAGCPLVGRLSDAMRRRKPLLLISALFGVAATSALLFLPYNNAYAIGAFFFCIGFAVSGESLSFAIITEIAPQKLRGTALGLNNTGMMVFASIIPPFITSIIRKGTGTGPLTEVAFVQGLSVMPFLFGLAFLIALLGIRETFCRQQNTVHKIHR